MELSIATGTATAVETQTVASVLPEHFELGAPELIKLLKAYYRHLNKELSPSFELNNLIRQHDVDTASDKYLDAIERMIGAAIPQSRSLDRVRLYKVIADYYNSRGSEESVYAFFRIFYDEFVTLIYPKEVLFTVGDPDKGIVSTENRVRDSFRYQEFSYVIKSESDQANWKNEYLKFVHPAGLKFFISLTLEIFADNDWVKEALEFYLDVEKVVKLTSELPTGSSAPANDTLYLVTDGDDSGSTTISYGNISKVFQYDATASPPVWNEVENVTALADRIDWSTFFGQHTPNHQYLNIAFTFLIKVLMGDGGFHYLTHVRSIFDKRGNIISDRNLIKAFFFNFILSRSTINENTIQTAYRQTWNKDGKFVDNAGWGEYGNLLISQGDAEYTKDSDGAFRFPIAFEQIDQSSEPFLDFIPDDLITEDFREPSDSPIVYAPSYLNSSTYTEGWLSFVFFAGGNSDYSPAQLDQTLIQYSTSDSPSSNSFIDLYGDRIEFGDDLIQVGDVYVNGDRVLDRNESAYSNTDATLDYLLPLAEGGWKHVLIKVKWKLPTGTITGEGGVDPQFRAFYKPEAFSRDDLNIIKFRSNLPDLLSRIQGTPKFSDVPAAFDVSFNTHFNNFSSGTLIDFYTRSFTDSFSLTSFDLLLDPDASPTVTENFLLAASSNILDDSSPANVIDTVHRFNSQSSGLCFKFFESEGYWALYDSDASPEDELLQSSNDNWTIFPYIPEVNELNTAWQVYDDSTVAQLHINSGFRFTNLTFDLGWTDDSSPYDSPLNLRSFLGGLDFEAGYTYDTKTPFFNSFTYTQT